MLSRKLLGSLLAAALLLHGALLGQLPQSVQTIGLLLLAGLIPGLLWVDLLIGRSTDPG